MVRDDANCGSLTLLDSSNVGTGGSGSGDFCFEITFDYHA